LGIACVPTAVQLKVLQSWGRTSCPSWACQQHQRTGGGYEMPLCSGSALLCLTAASTLNWFTLQPHQGARPLQDRCQATAEPDSNITSSL
jgi:hypothetical protein